MITANADIKHPKEYAPCRSPITSVPSSSASSSVCWAVSCCRVSSASASFSTFVIGVAAALLGMFVAHLFNVDGNTGVHLWKLHWDWIVLALQVGFAVIGIAIANVMTYTRLSDGAPAPRRRTRKRRTSRA